MDERDLVLGDAALHKRGLEIIVDAESTLGGLDGVHPIAAGVVDLVLGFLRLFEQGPCRLVSELSSAQHGLIRERRGLLAQILVLLQFLLSVLQRSTKVRKDKLRSLLSVPLLVARHDLASGAVQPGPGLSLGHFEIHQANIERGLARVAHQRQVIVLTLLWRPLAILQGLSAAPDFIHVLALLGAHGHGNGLPAAGLELRQRELPTLVLRVRLVRGLDLLHGYRVRHLVEHLQQLEGVVEAAERGHRLVAAGGRRLE